MCRVGRCAFGIGVERNTETGLETALGMVPKGSHVGIRANGDFRALDAESDDVGREVMMAAQQFTIGVVAIEADCEFHTSKHGNHTPAVGPAHACHCPCRIWYAKVMPNRSRRFASPALRIVYSWFCVVGFDTTRVRDGNEFHGSQ
jgi:hypothetical protein